MIIVLVHGFNVSDGGKRTIDTLIPHLVDMGYDVKEFDYGWVGLLGVRFGNKKRAKMLAAMAGPEDIVIGHSNGCAIMALAMEMGMTISSGVFIHPALNRTWCPPENAAKKITVYYSAKDRATWIAKFLINHIWGDMGTVGPVSVWDGWVSVDDGMGHSDGFLAPLMYCTNIDSVW